MGLDAPVPTQTLSLPNAAQAFGRPQGVTRAQQTAAWLRDYLTAVKHGRWHPFTSMERRVREATRNEPWCVGSSALAARLPPSHGEPQTVALQSAPCRSPASVRAHAPAPAEELAVPS